MRKTVLFCCSSANPEGGMQTWLERICSGVDRNRWRPVVALVRGMELHRPENFKETYLVLETVEIDGRGMAAEGRIRAVMRCVRRIKPDVFVPLTVIDAHDAICRLKLEGWPTKYLLTVIGNVPAQILDARRYRDFVDLAACPGELTCRLLEWAGLPGEGIRHIPNGATLPKRQRRARAEHGPLRLVYVGRMTQFDKRVLDLIPFCTALDELGVEYILDIVGDGPERHRLEQRLAPFRKMGKVRFHGRRSVDEIYETVYPNADCLLLFSASEGFGIAVVEAMMHGVVPVVSRFIGHGAEGIVDDGETGWLFDVGDTRAAAGLVKKLADEPGLLEALGEKARTRVLEKYTWERSIHSWEQAFDEIVQRPLRTGTSLPEKEGHRKGRLESIGLPVSLIDLIRRMRRAMVGVPEEMKGGEEWPWINEGHSADALAEVERVARELDTR